MRLNATGSVLALVACPWI